MKRQPEIYRSDWHGILLEITYEPQWMPAHVVGKDMAHIQVRSIHPTDAPLPITETGNRSHFVTASAVAAAGGHVAYVDVWLEVEGDTPVWRAREQAARQFPLF
jgi:hypothetical protein